MRLRKRGAAVVAAIVILLLSPRQGYTEIWDWLDYISEINPGPFKGISFSCRTPLPTRSFRKDFCTDASLGLLSVGKREQGDDRRLWFRVGYAYREGKLRSEEEASSVVRMNSIEATIETSRWWG